MKFVNFEIFNLLKIITKNLYLGYIELVTTWDV
jgi:hypothetical protein